MPQFTYRSARSGLVAGFGIALLVETVGLHILVGRHPLIAWVITVISLGTLAWLAAAGYLNLTKPATPNVLIMLGQPEQLRLPGGLGRQVRSFGVHVDQPPRLLGALSSGGVSMQPGTMQCSLTPGRA
jgi:hypothetical protein